MVSLRLKWVFNFLLALSLVSLFLVSACAGSSGSTKLQALTLKISSPTGGQTLTEGDITVNVLATNFNVVDKQGQANVAGEGHLHYFLDVAAPTTQGQPAIPSSGIWAHVASTSYTFGSVAPGPHTIYVELVNNDHTPLNPPVVTSISVKVTSNASLTIVSPTNGATLPAGDVAVTIQVGNFNVVDKQGAANVPGEGHIHYYLDVTAPTDQGKPAIPASGIWAHVASTTYTFANVSPGKHTISVELVNNDHTPLYLPVVATLTITVQ